MAEDSTKQTVNVSRTVRKQSLHAAVIRSCRQCGAPGYWHDIPDVNVGCYAPEKVTQLGSDPVGTVCPQCGTDREAIEPRGQIWMKQWRVGLWAALIETLHDLCKPLRWRMK